jgi:hypothetical protein
MGFNERDRDGEAAARTALQAMLPRLAEQPHVLLGVPPDASRDMLRSAFLKLTKQFHPTKYARFAPDVVRLANEVFLTIKRAYDQLVPSAPMFAGGTGVRPAVRASGTTPPATKPAPFGANIRAATNVGPPPAPPPARAVLKAPEPPKRPTQPMLQPVLRATTPPPVPTDDDFELAMDLLRRKLWPEARTAFHKLAAAVPNEKRYRSHMHYARGREAEAAGKLDEARAEWQRALAAEPDMQRAKLALADLSPTSSPSGGGLFSRFFKK